MELKVALKIIDEFVNSPLKYQLFNVEPDIETYIEQYNDNYNADSLNALIEEAIEKPTNIVYEDSYGGEGMDEYCYVFKITSEEYGVGYIRYSGYYSSWGGTEWDKNVGMVEPKEVVKIEWVNV